MSSEGMSVGVERDGERLRLPGLASVHSHAFQRALRGRAQRSSGSFWGWRAQMYRLVEALDPAAVYDLSRFAFIELAMAGVTAVGEFHYLHHGPDGTPYDDRLEFSSAVVEAALSAGLRITLLRVLYHRAGFGRALEVGQRRFVDLELDDALDDVSSLEKRYASEPRVRVGVAAHSLRACPLSWVESARAAADALEVPLHAHVSEQRREVQECLAEHGRRPVTLLAERGILEHPFAAVHATHLDAEEVRALGSARAFVALCRTTERDLGDGAPPTRALVRAGARLCFGVDSHASSDPFEEARAAELDARTSEEGRAVAATPEALLNAASAEGYAAIGLADRAREDQVWLDANDPALAGAPADRLTDAVVFGAGPRAVREVRVGGVGIVEDGRHPAYDEARRAFEATCRRLGLA